MKVHVKVTQDHINNGEPNSGTHCPIALSLKDLGYRHVFVDRDFIQLKGEDGILRVAGTTAAAIGVIDSFDQIKWATPTDFDLDFDR